MSARNRREEDDDDDDDDINENEDMTKRNVEGIKIVEKITLESYRCC